MSQLEVLIFLFVAGNNTWILIVCAGEAAREGGAAVGHPGGAEPARQGLPGTLEASFTWN